MIIVKWSQSVSDETKSSWYSEIIVTMFKNISGYVHHVFGMLCVMLTRQTCFPEGMGTEIQLITKQRLTFSPRLSSFVKWVTRIFYGSSAADILTTMGLAQTVRDFDLLQFTGGWHSHYDWPGLECTLFHCLMIHRRLTFSQRLTGLRKYVLSGSYGSSAAKILTTIRPTQVVRNFNLLRFIGG